MYATGDDIGAIVADIGSFATRVGYAGDDTPKAYLPTLTGVTTTNSKRDFHFDLSNFRQNISIESPLRDGVINDWEMFERLWECSIRNFVKTDLSESPLLMSEKPYNTSSARQKLCELMFEKYRVPAFFVSKDAVLSCYACGRTTGLTIDVGSNGTTITPVIDGWAETKAITRSIVGGRYLDAYTLSLLKTKGIEPLPLFRLIKTVTQDKRILVSQNPNIVNVHPSYDALMRLEIGRDLKESTCRVADSALVENDSRYSNIPLVPYELPDGTILDLGIERFQIPELLFDPTVNNLYLNDLNLLSLGHNNSQYPSTLEPIHKLAFDSILRCENDQYAPLLSNIIVTGGSSKFEGLLDRLKVDIEKIIINSSSSITSMSQASAISLGMKVKTIGTNTTERSLCTWLGGSILGSLGSFHEMWITKQEYDAYGSSIIEKKCP